MLADREGRRPGSRRLDGRWKTSTTRATSRSCTTSAGPQGPQPLQAGHGLHGQGRQGDHRGRVHRAADARPPLLRRPAPGPGGQGRSQDRKREPDPGHHHLPELLPHVREAGRHDRHRRHRGGGVQQDLQAGRDGHPHPQADDPHGPPGRHLQDREREVQGRGGGDQGAATSGPAGAGGHHLHREIRAAEPTC